MFGTAGLPDTNILQREPCWQCKEGDARQGPMAACSKKGDTVLGVRNSNTINRG